MEYKLSSNAKEDLWRIYNYGLYKFGERQADKYFEMLHVSFDRIAENPYLFPIAYRYKLEYRFCVCGVDIIYYKIQNDTVEIMFIVGRQDFL